MFTYAALSKDKTGRPGPYEGVELTILHRHEITGGVVVMRKFKASCTAPAHSHPKANEWAYVFSDEWRELGGSYTTGALLHSPKGVRDEPHFARTEVMSLAIFDGPLTVAWPSLLSASIRFLSRNRSCCIFVPMRYLVKARVKPGQESALLQAVAHGTLGKGSIAGDEYIHDMQKARVSDDGVACWVETCFCAAPLQEERPYWEEFFELLDVKDAHNRKNCRHENGTEPWACGDCDCTRRLEAWLRRRGKALLASLRTSGPQTSECSCPVNKS